VIEDAESFLIRQMHHMFSLAGRRYGDTTGEFFRMFQIVLNEKHPHTAVGAVQMNGFHEDLPQEFFAFFHSVKSPLAAVHRLGGEGKKLYHGSSRGRSTLL